MAEHKIKEQTKKHCKRMKSILKEILDCGFTKDDVIDVGDYVLNEMTLEELKGDATQKTDTKPAKSGATESDNKGKESKQKAKPAKDKQKDKGKKSKGK